jgi:pimeloyl-ACP methyl ester carboxylesterase
MRAIGPLSAGHSFGGFVGLCTSRDNENVLGSALFSAVYKPEETIDRAQPLFNIRKLQSNTITGRIIRTSAGYLLKQLVNRSTVQGTKLRTRFNINELEIVFKSLDRTPDAVKFLDEISGPILSIHGTKDNRTKYDDCIDFVQEAGRKGKDIELMTIEGGNHNMFVDPVAVEQMADRFQAWMNRKAIELYSDT